MIIYIRDYYELVHIRLPNDLGGAYLVQDVRWTIAGWHNGWHFDGVASL